MSTDAGAHAQATLRDAVSLAAAQVLGLERVDASRDFFDLGGSSLSVALLTEQLESMLGMECPMQLLYEHPVLADFAEALRSRQPKQVNPMYEAEIHAFGEPVQHARLSLADATLLIRDRKAAAILLDLVRPDELDSWWNDKAFPEVTQHQSFPGAGKSGIAIGPTQRLVKEQLVPGLIDYFAYAGRCNAGLRQTKFVQLCERELRATPVRVGDWAELPLVSKREYHVVEGRLYSLPPHCDAIHFGREPEHWPIKPDYDEGFDQLSLFLSIKDVEDPAALVIWDYRTPDRPALDALMGEFARTGRVQALEGVPTVAFKGRPGQLHVLNARTIHALQPCKGVRRTMGSFAVWHDGGWRIFH